MYIFYQMLGTAVLDSSLCLLLFHLLYPIFPYFPKEIFLGPSSFTPLAQTCLLPPSALLYAMLEYTAVLVEEE